MLFNHLDDKVFTPLSSASQPRFYAFLLERMITQLFSVDATEYDDEDVIEGFPTRNKVIHFINKMCDEFSSDSLSDGQYPSSARESYSLLKECGWFEETLIGFKWVVDLTSGVKAMGNFLVKDLQNIYKTNEIELITDDTNSIVSSLASFLGENKTPEIRISELRNARNGIKRLTNNMDTLIKEIKNSSKRILENQKITDVKTIFFNDFERLIINCFSAIDNVKTSPYLIQSEIDDIQSVLYGYADKNLSDIITSICESSDKYQTTDDVILEIDGFLNEISKCINQINGLRSRCSRYKDDMVRQFRSRMKIMRIYHGRSDNSKEIIQKTLAIMNEKDKSPVINLDLDFELLNKEATTLIERKRNIIKEQILKNHTHNPESLAYDRAKKEFNIIFTRSRHEVIKDIFSNMKKGDILHSDELNIDNLKDFANLFTLIKVHPLYPIEINGVKIQRISGQTNKDGWMSFPAFTIEKV